METEIERRRKSKRLYSQIYFNIQCFCQALEQRTKDKENNFKTENKFTPLTQNSQSSGLRHITACIRNAIILPNWVSVSHTGLFTVCQTAFYKMDKRPLYN